MYPSHLTAMYFEPAAQPLPLPPPLPPPCMLLMLQGADITEVLKRLQRFKNDNFRMKVQRVEFNNKIAQLTQEKQELEEVGG